MIGVGGLRLAIYCSKSGTGGAGAWSMCAINLIHHVPEDLNWLLNMSARIGEARSYSREINEIDEDNTERANSLRIRRYNSNKESATAVRNWRKKGTRNSEIWNGAREADQGKSERAFGAQLIQRAEERRTVKMRGESAQINSGRTDPPRGPKHKEGAWAITWSAIWNPISCFKVAMSEIHLRKQRFAAGGIEYEVDLLRILGGRGAGHWREVKWSRHVSQGIWVKHKNQGMNWCRFAWLHWRFPFSREHAWLARLSASWLLKRRTWKKWYSQSCDSRFLHRPMIWWRKILEACLLLFIKLMIMAELPKIRALLISCFWSCNSPW